MSNDSITEAKDLSEAVHLSVGAASTCWESMSGTGVFQDDRARQIADDLMTFVNEHYVAKAVEKIICPACAQQEAVPINFDMHPATKDQWKCGACGVMFAAKDHS